MTIPTIVGTGAVVNIGGNTALSVPIPSGKANGDLLVIVANINDDSITVTATAGWVLEKTVVSNGGRRLSIYSKISDGTETSCTLTKGGIVNIIAAAICFRGVYAATPITGIVSSVATTSSTTITYPTTSTTVADCLVVNVDSNASSSGGGSQTRTSWTNASLVSIAGYIAGFVSTYGYIVLGAGGKSSAGTVDATTNTCSAAQTPISITFVINSTQPITATNNNLFFGSNF